MDEKDFKINEIDKSCNHLYIQYFYVRELNPKTPSEKHYEKYGRKVLPKRPFGHTRTEVGLHW